jgi:hypothetical protein
MHHPEEEFSAYLDRELNSDAVGEIEAHLKECPTCVRKLNALRELNEVLRSAPELQPSPGFSKRVLQRVEQDRQSRHSFAKWMVLGLAAVIVFVVLILRLQQQANEPVQVKQPKVVSKPRVEKPVPSKPEPVVAEKKPDRPIVRPPISKPPVESPNPTEVKEMAEVKPENPELAPGNPIAEVKPEQNENPVVTKQDELTSEEIDLIANLDEIENMDVINNYDQLENLEVALFSAGEEKKHE